MTDSYIDRDKEMVVYIDVDIEERVVKMAVAPADIDSGAIAEAGLPIIAVNTDRARGIALILLRCAALVDVLNDRTDGPGAT